MNKKNQIITAFTLALTMSACTPATTIIIEKRPDGSTRETITVPSQLKKETKKTIGIVGAVAAMKAIDNNIFPYIQLVTNYMISKKKIEKGIAEPNI